ncbi:MAG: aminotransferase class V-fold PLP-dependent enzyme [Acidobacteriota bacterium]
MSPSRRAFLKNMGLGIGALGLNGLSFKEAQAGLAEALKEAGNKPAEEIAQDENFWIQVQQAFATDRSLINLNNGGVHPAPRIAIQAAQRYMEFSNGAPAYNSWSILRPRKELIRKKIAETFGCSPEEIALTRNVTESMQIALLGLELKPGDEVLTTTHDYPSMKNALFQREKREGVKVRTFSFPYPPKNLGELTEFFESKVTSRTRLILICHITNLTGQIFPVQEICRMARSRGIEVVIDGAHAFGHWVFSQKDLGCDIYGANLHKWMMAPIGTGFLYVKKDRIKDIWPLFPAPDPLGNDIRKFEHIGTHQEYLKLAIGEALEFHHAIGGKRKEERLRYLRNYWANALMEYPSVKILTSFDREQSCGIGTFTVENMDMKKLSEVLFSEHKIYTISLEVPPPYEGEKALSAIRVTPSIYTPLKDLDLFIEAVGYYIKNGLPV